MPVQTLTSAADLADYAPGSTVVAKMYATWCGPCKAFAPIFERAADKPQNSGLTFAQADIEVASDLTEALGVQTVPTIRAITIVADGNHDVQSLEWPITPANFSAFIEDLQS